MVYWKYFFSMKDLKRIGPLFIIIGALLWSIDGLLRRSLFSLPPSTVVFLEHMIGLIIMTPFLLKKVVKESVMMQKKEWIALGVIGLFSGALGTIFYTAALAKVNYIQFSVVALLQQLQPIWAIIMAAVLLKEKLTKNFIGWALLAIVASYYVTFKDLGLMGDMNANAIIAAVLALLAGIMWGSTTSFSKIILNKVSSQTGTYYRFAAAPIFALMFMGILGQMGSLGTITQNQWITILVITLSTGMVAQLIYYFGLRQTSGRVTAICELVWPASAVLIDYIYFHNTLSWTQIIGIFFVLISIYKVTTLHHEQRLA